MCNCDDLNHQINAYEREIEDYKQQLDLCEEKVDDLKYQVDTYEEEVENLKDKLDKSNEKIEELESQVSDYQRMLVRIFLDVFSKEFPALKEIEGYELNVVIDDMAYLDDDIGIDEIIVRTVWEVFSKQITKDAARLLRGATFKELQTRLENMMGISEADKD